MVWLLLLPTALAAPSVRPSVCLSVGLFPLHPITSELEFLYVYGFMTTGRLGLRVKVIGQSQGLGLSID